MAEIPHRLATSAQAPPWARYPAAVDPLGRTLHAFRFRSAVFCDLQGGTPWALQVPAIEGASFHIALSGRCHVACADGEATLEAGDLLLVRSGAAQVLGDAPGRAPTPLQDLVSRMHQSSGIRASLGPPPVRTRIVCGAFRFDPRLFGPLLAFLPPMLRVRRGEYALRLLGSIVSAVEGELTGRRPASDLVLARLGDLLFVEMLRTALERGGLVRDRASWARALQEPALCRVITAMHDDLGRRWTVDALASIAGASRSAFTARFREVVGMSAREYLTHWRMTHAAGQLEDTERTLPEIAESVGYGSEVAFAKAFKATVGVPPGRYRSEAHRRRTAPIPAP